MKKIIALFMLCGMCILPCTGWAQGIEGGDSMFTVYGGLGSALQKSGLNVGGKDLSGGNIGGEFGLSYLYFPFPYFGAGADYHVSNVTGRRTENNYVSLVVSLRFK